VSEPDAVVAAVNAAFAGDAYPDTEAFRLAHDIIDDQDCTCADEADSTCWYHLSAAERRAIVVSLVRERLAP
jgi:hypothetical protein